MLSLFDQPRFGDFSNNLCPTKNKFTICRDPHLPQIQVRRPAGKHRHRMAINDDEAKAKLIAYKESGQKKADAAADGLHDGLDNATEVAKRKLEDAGTVIDNLREDASHLQHEVAENIDHYSNVADQTAGEYLHLVKSSANNAQVAFDDGLGAASDAVKNGAAQARFQYSRAYQRVQVTCSSAGMNLD